MKQALTITVNGMEKQLFARNASTLLQVLREQLGLTGAKHGCDNGDCGACTVLVDHKPFNACHMLAIEANNKQIMTIEGLEHTPIQEKFIEHWAIQCGYCTPGFVLNCHALIEQHPNADETIIDDWLDSNICRCTGYEEIKEAVQALVQEKAQHGNN